MLLPPYPIQHYFSIIWQLVLEDMLESFFYDYVF